MYRENRSRAKMLWEFELSWCRLRWDLPMCRCHSHPGYLLPVIAIALAIYWLMDGFGSPAATDHDAMVGTWTDENGEPGNSIRFYSVPVDLPGSPIVRGFEGHGTVVGWLGEKQATAEWNFGSFDPLVLNVNVGKTMWFAAVRKLDEDHILIRFGRDPEEMMRPGATDHPDTKRLTRIAREP